MRGIVEAISSGTISRFLNAVDLQPHRMRYWLHATVEDREAFDHQVRAVCEIYQAAERLEAQGVHVACVDEKSGIQALERAHEGQPMRPGKVELQEFEYKRHGTQCLIATFHVATGQVYGSVQATRCEKDVLAHLQATIEIDPDGGWIFVLDRLNTHMSESLVRLVAERCGLDLDLGEKGKSGILESLKTREKFLTDPAHRIRFLYTPKHTSWLNQIEIWFSILVRKLIRRASFRSVEELRTRILEFISYFNKTMAKPFKWTYAGRALQAA